MGRSNLMEHFNMSNGLTNSILKFISLNAGAVAGSNAAVRLASYRQPRPMPHQMAGLLDSSIRMAYRDPAQMLGEFGIASGMSVLDLGCGSGTFTLAMANMVGADGQVHAVDIQPPLVDQTRRRVAAAQLSDRVQCHCSSAYSLPLADDSVDCVIMIATLAEIPDKQKALAEVRRVLKPMGRLAVSEELPDPAYAPAFLASQWIEDAGFQFGGKSGTFFCYNLLYFNSK